MNIHFFNGCGLWSSLKIKKSVRLPVGYVLAGIKVKELFVELTTHKFPKHALELSAFNEECYVQLVWTLLIVLMIKICNLQSRTDDTRVVALTL